MRQNGQWLEPPKARGWLDGSYAAEAIRGEVSEGQRVAFVSGNFNVVHPGHLRLLKFAAENADVLVVGINPDGSHDISVSAALRLETLESIKVVDHVVLLDQPLAEFVGRLRPDIVVKGSEHRDRFNVEEGLVAAYGGRLIFGSGDISFSSLEILYQEVDRPRDRQAVRADGFMDRHDFSNSDLRATLDRIAGLRVTVIGDLILDAYIDCEPVGMSQEDPTVVVTPLAEKAFVGGAGIVAAHARGLGADVHFVTVVGDDEHADFALDELNASGVQTSFLLDATRPTTLKQRYRAHNKTLLRVNKLRQHSVDDDLIKRILSRFDDIADRTDLLLFSDFNYGCLPQPLVDALVQRSQARRIMTAADSQASSQFANIARFKDMALVTPTEREARLAVQDFESGLAVIAEKLYAAARPEHIIVTLGPQGLLVRSWKDGDRFTDSLPAFNAAPMDTAGAGDTLFACTSLGLRAGADIWQSVYLGSIAAACQVRRVGNKPLSANTMLAEISDNRA